MKIAIPMDENKLDVCVSFGRAPYFLFWDSETESSELKENPAAEAQGGAGLKAAQVLLDEKTDVLITIRCGENAANIFKTTGMKIYKAEVSNALENISLYKENKLGELTHFHAGFHGAR